MRRPNHGWTDGRLDGWTTDTLQASGAFYANTRISALTLDNFRSHGRLQIRSSTRPSPLERPPLEVRYCSIPLCRRTVFPSPRRRPRVAYLCRAATNEHALVEPRLPRSPASAPSLATLSSHSLRSGRVCILRLRSAFDSTPSTASIRAGELGIQYLPISRAPRRRENIYLSLFSRIYLAVFGKASRNFAFGAHMHIYPHDMRPALHLPSMFALR